MANQNSIADLSTTTTSNTNWKGQSIVGAVQLAMNLDEAERNISAMLKAMYDSLGGTATVSGTNTLTVTVTEDWAALQSGLLLAIKTPNANTGAVTLSVTVPTAGALGAKAIRLQGDSALTGGEMVANGVYLLRYSSTYNSSAGAWVLLNPANAGSAGRQKLAAATTYYVRTDGSDSNTGLANTAGGAFLTIQKAWNVIVTLDLAGFVATIQIADGTYTSGLLATVSPFGGTVTIQGNSGTPANVLISVTSGQCFSVSYQGPTLTIKDLKVQTTTSGSGFFIASGTSVSFTNIDFGACATAHMYLNSGGNLINSGNYTISGGATMHLKGENGGKVTIASSATVTISGTPAFSTAFASATSGAIVTSAGVTWSGSATGTRYSATVNGIINTFGAGATYFPGNVAGTTATGGQYA